MTTKTALLIVLSLAASGSVGGASPSVVTGNIGDAAGVLRIDPSHVSVQWAGPGPVDLFWSDRPDTDLASARLLSRNVRRPGRRENANDIPRPYFLLRTVRDGAVIRVAERVLPLERGSNFRDIGGYPAANGRHVRWGLIYRSAATPLLSDRDLRYLRDLNLTAMIDLRSQEERELAPTRLSGEGIHYIAFDYRFDTLLPETQTESTDAGTLYRQWLTLLAPQFQAVFRALLEHEGPILYHCTAGQDRTGVATALVLLALGVPREVILEDYLLSTQYRHPEYEMAELDLSRYPGNRAAALLSQARTEKPAPLQEPSGRPYLSAVFDELEQRWGGIDNYLRVELGVEATQVARLRAEYLE